MFGPTAVLTWKPTQGGSEIPVGDRPWLLVMAWLQKKHLAFSLHHFKDLQSNFGRFVDLPLITVGGSLAITCFMALKSLDLRANHGRLCTAVVVYLVPIGFTEIVKRTILSPTGWQPDRIDAHWISEFWSPQLQHSQLIPGLLLWAPCWEVVHTRAEICKLHASKDGHTGVEEHLSC